MSAHAGRHLLLKVETADASQFETIGGLRARTLDLTQELVNVTHGQSEGRWRELLGDAGLRHGKIAGSGLFRDATSDARVRTLFFDGAVANWQIVIPQFGTITGPFLVAMLEYAGKHDDAITFDMVLESAGVLRFAAL